MATWADLRTDIRYLLGDTGVSVWTNAELLLYVNYAIRDYSKYFPQDKSTTLSTDGSTQEWTLPTDMVWQDGRGVNRVAFYEGGQDEPRFLEEIQILPGTEFYDVSSQYPLMYYVEGGKIKFTSPPDSDDDVTLYYYAKHTEMSLDTTTLTVPDGDLELLSLYVASRATMKLSIDDARLSRWDQSGMDAGNPTHNPLLPIHRQFESEYKEKLYERFPKGVVEFYRKGRGE